MSCGCNKRSSKMVGSVQQASTVSQSSSVTSGVSVNGRTYVKSGGEEYSESSGCRQCLAKHLSKAAVEASEYFEEQGREAEFSLCIGDIACAEDHAASLGLRDTKVKLRSVRDMMWSGDQGAVALLREMAVNAVKSAMAVSAASKAAPASVVSVEPPSGAIDSGLANDASNT